MKISVILLFICFSSAQVLIAAANQKSGGALTKVINNFEVFADGRVTGGQNAVPHSAPWIVSMQYRSSHICGGSIIAAKWVVTAGHCPHAIPSHGNVVVIAGRHNLMVSENSEQRRDIKREKIWIHKKYTGPVAPYDIALIRLEQGFKFNSYVASIRLPSAGKEYYGNVRLHGWGSTSMTSIPSMPSILQTVLQPIISLKECADVFGQGLLHYTNICAGTLKGGVSACSGDSGGPISQDRVLVGITSWIGLPCGSSPSVYVAVSAFVEWINDIIDKH